MSAAAPRMFQDEPISYNEDGTRVGAEIPSGKQTKGNIVFFDTTGCAYVNTQFVSAFAGGNIIVGGDIAVVAS